jgi:hypothetical protein
LLDFEVTAFSTASILAHQRDGHGHHISNEAILEAVERSVSLLSQSISVVNAVEHSTGINANNYKDMIAKHRQIAECVHAIRAFIEVNCLQLSCIFTNNFTEICEENSFTRPT